MIEDNQLTALQHGVGYTVGELAPSQHPTLNFLKQGTLVAKFDGVEHALDYIKQEMPQPQKEGASATPKSDDEDFYTFETYDEAMDTYRHHPETIAKFDEAELRIKDVNESGTIVDYDVQGDYIDMGRYMEGVPESFGSLYNGKARNRRIRILVNTNQVHWMSEEAINHRAERILRLVDALEVGGARCELTAIDANECGYTEVKIKRYDESLVINDLAIVSHGDWKRRIIFRLNEYSKTFSYGYGNAMKFGDTVEPDTIKSENVNELTVFINGSINEEIDKKFDQLEALLVWELSKPIPEVDAIKLDRSGLYFSENGSRDGTEVQREGQEILENV